MSFQDESGVFKFKMKKKGDDHMPRLSNNTQTTSKPRKRRPATSPEDRENQLIAMAYDAAEERILNRTATSQEICHFLKLGSSKERIEKEIMERQRELITAKTEALKAAKRMEEVYEKAIQAIQLYSGEIDDEEDV